MFLGSSTNARQFEGGYDKDGRGLSISDYKNLKDNPDDLNLVYRASDHYHHLEEDIKLLSEMGIQAYRFTISWSRIFPKGNNETANQKGLEFYDRMLKELEKYNIEPICMLYAYDLPYHLIVEYGGWMNRKCIDLFLKYVETVVSYFKGRIRYYVPFNQQNFLFMDTQQMTGTLPKNQSEYFMLEHHMNLAYAKSTQLIHQIDENIKVGASIGNSCFYPMTCNPKNIELVDEIYYVQGLGYADIYIRGEYTKKYLNRFKDVEIDQIILSNDLNIIKKTKTDFLSLTYYLSSPIGFDKLDMSSVSLIKGLNPYTKQTKWGWNIDPYGFKHMLEDFYHRYQLPLMVLENGYASIDEIGENGIINDDERINYIKKHIERMKEAIDDGVEILGYLTWSAFDLYSSREGFDKRYGFIYIDKTTLERKKKKSFYWYKKLIEEEKKNGR